jgi:hypothetical protein
MSKKLKIEKSDGKMTMSKLVNLYREIQLDANNEHSRGGSNDLWSDYEYAVSKFETQTGQKWSSIHAEVMKQYADRTKKGRGSAGPAGQTMQRAEY